MDPNLLPIPIIEYQTKKFIIFQQLIHLSFGDNERILDVFHNDPGSVFAPEEVLNLF